jgi:hypothetical protein
MRRARPTGSDSCSHRHPSRHRTHTSSRLQRTHGTSIHCSVLPAVNTARADLYTPLTAAIRFNDLSGLELLCQCEHIDPAREDEYGLSPLFYAAYWDNGSLEVLLTHFPVLTREVFVKSSASGWSPLFGAAKNGQVNAVRKLLLATCGCVMATGDGLADAGSAKVLIPSPRGCAGCGVVPHPLAVREELVSAARVALAGRHHTIVHMLMEQVARCQ